MKKKGILLVFLILIVVSCSVTFIIQNYNKHQLEQQILKKEKEEKELISKITNHYNDYVKTNREAKIYEYKDDKYYEIGKIGKSVELSLEKQTITSETKYFLIKGLNYYISYEDVEKIGSLNEIDKRYKNYIPFNENIVTKNITNLYNQNGLVYSINKSFEFPIIIKDNKKYFIEYLNQLFYVLEDDVEKIVNEKNNEENTAQRIAVLNYHFFYDPSLGEKCNTIICMTAQNFEKHLQYITDNQFLTVTMWEFEKFIEGNLRLPKKSVLLTIDDGAMGVANKAIPLLEKYNQMATLFLITGWWPLSNYVSKNLEIHSHGHNIHNQNECPGYGLQGGAILCKDKNYLLDDLSKSRKLLNNTTAFCYPFYDYNSYSIEVLKEAGFTIAFRGGNIKANIGVDKFKVPRFTIMSYTTFEEFKKIIN